MAARTFPVPLPPATALPTAVVAAGAAPALAVEIAVVAVAGPVAGLLAAALVPAAVAAAVDQRSGRIPNTLVALTAALPVMLILGGVVAPVTAMSGAALAAAPMLAVHLVHPAAMGFGDVKLAAVLGAVLAPVDVRGGMVAVAVGAALALFVAVTRGRREVPFAPALVAGASVVLVALLALGWEAPRWR